MKTEVDQIDLQTHSLQEQNCLRFSGIAHTETPEKSASFMPQNTMPCVFFSDSDLGLRDTFKCSLQILHNLYLKVTICLYVLSLHIQEYGHCPIKATDF